MSCDIYLDVDYHPVNRQEGVMRKPAQEAARTRARIVATAAGKFREAGIVATGLNGLMHAAGLTHGGFYKHFESKDQLVADACAYIAGTVTSAMVEQASEAPAPERLATFISAYLSPAHRDHPETGCGLAALGCEIGRMGESARASGTEAFGELTAALVTLDPRLRGPGGEARARAAVATMVGAIVSARAVGDANLSCAILKDARSSLLKQLDAPAAGDSKSPCGAARKNG
jgi:TetR/AcrR family transcriptional regulator, transcriptional repressor for nem operon